MIKNISFRKEKVMMKKLEYRIGKRRDEATVFNFIVKLLFKKEISF